MTHKEYNGWTNYETWLVKLWMDNEEGPYHYWREQAGFLLSAQGQSAHRARFYNGYSKEELAKAALSEQLEEEHQDNLPKLEGFAADLMNAALSEVNWGEIAGSLLEDAKEALAQ